MAKRKLGILTFSDGRKRIHDYFLETNKAYLSRLTEALKKTGELDLVVADKIIHTPELAKTQAETLK